MFSFIVIFFYYLSPSHKEIFNGYLIFFILIWSFYSIYKYFKTFFSGEKVSYSIKELIQYFLYILFVSCFLYFYFNHLNLLDSIWLFFKIIIYTIVPFLILFISTSFWKQIIFKIGLLKKDEKIFSFLISLSFWFFSFVTLIFILGLFWFYNIYSVLSVLLLFLAISYKNIISNFLGLLNFKIEFDNHILDWNNLVKKINLYLLSSEFLFLVASLIISVNFISIIRPMPIGWDDLWVYMNYPRQMVNSWDVTFLWWMYAWQIFTGIWYMISEPIQAFFFNNVGWVLSFIVIILVVADLLKTTKKRFLNIPLLLATIFISMPMIIFQQAKDMKLDSGLFFFSLIVLYLVYKVFFLDYFSKKVKIVDKIKDSLWFFNWEKKNLLIFIFIIGLLSGFAFSIKFTSLLLIVSIISVLFYSKLGGLGFLGYLFLFISIFTKLGLWKYMNIVYPKDNLVLINLVSIFTFILSLLFFAWAIKRYSLKDFKDVLLKLFIFIIWIIVSLSPWIYKNITQTLEANKNITLYTLLSWNQKKFVIDYTKIYPKNEVEKIKEKIKKENSLSSSWTIWNEDWWRYLGYEKWINNFVKLPWNLTMQVNQWWEFTTIWWLFLALIPGLFLFLPYRKDRFDIFPIILIWFEILLFVIPETRILFTDLLAKIDLPNGYIVLFLLFLIPTLYFLYALKNTKFTVLFKVNLVFTSFYTFLWTISAYWVVWYGIMMYFWMLLMIGIGLHYIVSYKEDEDKKSLILKMYSSVVVFWIFLVWFLMSVFPHTFNNLKNAWYPYIKMGLFTPTELIFAYHKDYLPILYNLNIKNTARDKFLEDSFSDENLKILAKPYLGDVKKLDAFLNLLEKKQYSRVLWNLSSKLSNKEKLKLSKDAKNTKLNIYNGILNPKDDYKNTTWIYRIGTFLRYFIVNNYDRLYEDSLLKNFDYYFNDKNPDIVVDRMKKFWLKYLLVDLNAATIDKDPKHDLTRRYEDLLRTFTSDKLKLIETDSICLKLAREKYYYSNHTKKDLQDYINLAFVNSESYKDWKVINRWTKLAKCYEEIIDTIKSWEVSNNRYEYLIPIVNWINANPQLAKNIKALSKFLQQNVPAWSKVLFEIR